MAVIITGTKKHEGERRPPEKTHAATKEGARSSDKPPAAAKEGDRPSDKPPAGTKESSQKPATGMLFDSG